MKTRRLNANLNNYLNLVTKEKYEFTFAPKLCFAAFGRNKVYNNIFLATSKKFTRTSE